VAESVLLRRETNRDVRLGSFSDLGARSCEVSLTSMNGHRQADPPCPKSAKLGNGSRRKIALHCEPKAHFLLDPDRLSSRCPKAYLG
jgi:hypothetical protein